MKYLYLIMLLSMTAFADTPGPMCEKVTLTVCEGQKAVIISKKKKKKLIAKKEQTTTNTEKVIEKHVFVTKKENKNILMLELRKDVKDVSTSTSGNTATTKLNKDIIAGVNYYRRQVIKDVGFGVGVDTNSTVKGMLGYEW